MNNLIKAWHLSPGKVILLILGCSFEFSNFQNLTFEFMQQYRPLWGELNQLIAVFGAGFLILGIVEYGMSDDEDDQKISWGLALVAMAFSYVLYDTAFKGQEDYWSKTRFVQVILSILIPSLVAYNTHSLYLMVKANEQPPVVQEKKKASEVHVNADVGNISIAPIKLGQTHGNTIPIVLTK